MAYAKPQNAVAVTVMCGLLLSVTVPMNALADCEPWTKLGEGGPEGRAAHGMVYDSGRDVLVLYGGLTQDSFAPAFADTWEWDGETWTMVAGEEDGPGENRRNFAMAYDSQRGVTVLFGGRTGPMSGDPSLGDTWEWDGENWSLVAESGPSPRHSHAMDYDSNREVVVLFGGNSNDTWEWDGDTWMQVASGGPAARIDHAMAYDSAREVTALYAGVTSGPFGGVMLNDTWEWDGKSWQQKAVGPGLEAVKWHAMDYDIAAGGTTRWSGFGASQFDPQGTYFWNGETWANILDDGPPSRWLHAMAYHKQLQGMILFGGRLEEGLIHTNDMWFLPSCVDSIFGDLNGDGVVDVLDLLILLEEWGPCSNPADCPADLNGDGEVNVLDLLILLENWG